MSTDAGRQNEMILALDGLVNALQDSQKGLADIGDQLKDEKLKRYFLAESLKHASFRGEIEEVLHQSGVHDIREHGTAVGTVNRVWGDLKAKLGGGDHMLLATAESAGDALKDAYDAALKSEIPLMLREMLGSQREHVLVSQDFIHSYREAAVAR